MQVSEVGGQCTEELDLINTSIRATSRVQSRKEEDYLNVALYCYSWA
jgi:hypothetical protein